MSRATAPHPTRRLPLHKTQSPHVRGPLPREVAPSAQGPPFEITPSGSVSSVSQLWPDWLVPLRKEDVDPDHACHALARGIPTVRGVRNRLSLPNVPEKPPSQDGKPFHARQGLEMLRRLV